MDVILRPKATPFMILSIITMLAGTALSGTLTGTVVDDFYSNPVPDVEVSVFQSDSTLAGIDTTDTNGVYAFTLTAGEYYAFFAKENYADTIISDITITPEGTTIIDLTFDFIGVCQYVVGDVNGSANLNGMDITYGINYFEYGSPEPQNCLCECTPGHYWFVCGDVNGSCTYNGVDITFLAAYGPGGPFPTPCPDCPPAE